MIEIKATSIHCKFHMYLKKREKLRQEPNKMDEKVMDEL